MDSKAPKVKPHNLKHHANRIERFSRLPSFIAILGGLFALMLLGACSASNPAASPPAPASEASIVTSQLPVVGSSETSTGGVTIELAGGSVARYLVQEQLANRNLPNDAIGETSDINGLIVFNSDGEVQADRSKITVNLAALKSDEAKRDNFIKGNSLESNRFPSAEIVITGITGLPWPLPDSGEASFQITGNMTVHGVTQPVIWETLAEFGSDHLTGQSKTVVTFDQFSISKPSLLFILSLNDQIRVELDFVASVARGT